jgi:hypothetical protein
MRNHFVLGMLVFLVCGALVLIPEALAKSPRYDGSEELPEATSTIKLKPKSDGPFKTLKEACSSCAVEKTFSGLSKPYLEAKVMSQLTAPEVSNKYKMYYLVIRTKLGWFSARLGDNGIPDCPVGSFPTSLMDSLSFLIEDVIPGGAPEFLMLTSHKSEIYEADQARVCAADKKGNVSCLVEQSLLFARRPIGSTAPMKRVMKGAVSQDGTPQYTLQSLKKLVHIQF